MFGGAWRVCEEKCRTTMAALGVLGSAVESLACLWESFQCGEPCVVSVLTCRLEICCASDRLEAKGRDAAKSVRSFSW